MTVDNNPFTANAGATIAGSHADVTQPHALSRPPNSPAPSAEAVNEFEALLNADSAEETVGETSSAPTTADIEQRMRDTIIREVITKHTTIDL